PRRGAPAHDCDPRAFPRRADPASRARGYGRATSPVRGGCQACGQEARRPAAGRRSAGVSATPDSAVTCAAYPTRSKSSTMTRSFQVRNMLRSMRVPHQVGTGAGQPTEKSWQSRPAIATANPGEAAMPVTGPSPVTSASRRSRRVQRKADGEYRTAARVVSRVDVTAVEARVLPGDRQAQAAALGTCPRRVGFEEPVEYMRDRGRGQPAAVVSYFHGQLPAARA